MWGPTNSLRFWGDPKRSSNFKGTKKWPQILGRKGQKILRFWWDQNNSIRRLFDHRTTNERLCRDDTHVFNKIGNFQWGRVHGRPSVRLVQNKSQHQRLQKGSHCITIAVGTSCIRTSSCHTYWLDQGELSFISTWNLRFLLPTNVVRVKIKGFRHIRALYWLFYDATREGRRGEGRRRGYLMADFNINTFNN